MYIINILYTKKLIFNYIYYRYGRNKCGFSNPFLYISVFSVLSAGVNLYYCCSSQKYKKSESEIQLTSIVCHDSPQDNMNKVIETSR